MDATTHRTRADGAGVGAVRSRDPQLSEGPHSVIGMDATKRGDGADEAGSRAARGVGAVLSAALEALSQVDHDREHASDAERLEWLLAAQQLARRTEALHKQLVAEADAAGSSMRLHGTPTTSWLALDGKISTREAAGLVNSGKKICSHPEVITQTLSGNITPTQATAITKVMDELPVTLTPEEVKHAQDILIKKAGHTPAEDIRRSTGAIIEEVRPSPTEADRITAEQLRLAEQQRRAHRRRSLFIWDDGDGSTKFKGSLPTLEGETLRRLISAYVENDRRRGRDEADPRAEERTQEQRRADALVQLLTSHQQQRGAPGVAGDRPRVVVVMQEDSLRQRAEQAGRISTGQPIPAGELRRIVCDAELAPVVLGGTSEVLDVGRSSRLVTAPLRRALTVRDGGCQFPNCDVADERCEAHHIRPWWAGGETSLANLVLLCPHHHRLIEPERFWTNPGADSWQVRFRPDGAPEFLPPTRVDPTRKPILGNASRKQSTAASGRGDRGQQQLVPNSGGGGPPDRTGLRDDGTILDAWEGDPDLMVGDGNGAGAPPVDCEEAPLPRARSA